MHAFKLMPVPCALIQVPKTLPEYTQRPGGRVYHHDISCQPVCLRSLELTLARALFVLLLPSPLH